MTRQSRTPRRASGTFVPPLASVVTPRRSPRLLAKRRHQHPEPSSCAEGQLPVPAFNSELLSPTQTGPNWVMANYVHKGSPRLVPPQV